MDSLPDPKVEKKRAKTEIKAEKKRAKHAAATGDVSAPASPSLPTSAGPTPAERSAAAAERQVRLQRWRVVIALGTLLIALVTFAWTMKPWKWFDESDATPDTKAPNVNSSDGE